MPSILLDILAFGHIISAMSWLGSGILITFVIGPNVKTLAPAAALEFNAKVLPKILRFVQAAIGLTFAFGLLLMYFLYDRDLTYLSKTNQGLEIVVGTVLALGASAVVFSLTVPSFKKVIKIAGEAVAAGKPPAPEIMKYAKRARQGSLIALSLLLLVLAMMVAAGFNYP